MRWPRNPFLQAPRATLAATGLLTVFFAFWGSRIGFDSSIETLIRDHDPDYAAYNEYKLKFGQAEMLVVALEAQDLFQPKHLELLSRLTARLGKLDNLYDVKSLANAEYLRSTEDSFEAVTLFDQGIPADPKLLEAKRRFAVAHPLFQRDLVSLDGRKAAVLITLRVRDASYAYEAELDAVQRIIDEESARSGTKLWLAGNRQVDRSFLQCIYSDLATFIPPTWLLMLLLMWVAFRSLRDTAIGILVASCSLVWLLGLMALTGYRITVVTSGLPSLILCIAVLNVIHFIHRFRATLKEHPNWSVALEQTVRDLLGPVFMCNFTTAAGFASNLFNDVQPILEFSILAAAGILICFLLTLTLLPALLQVWRERPDRKYIGRGDWQLVPARFSIRLQALVLNRPKTLAAGCLLVFAGTLAGIPFLKNQTDRIGYLKDGNPVKQAVTFIEKNLAGTNQLDIAIETGQEGLIKEPWVLAKLEALSVFLRGLPETDRVLSINDFLKEMNRSFHNEDALPHAQSPHYRLPESREAVAQYLLIYSLSGRRNELDKYVDYPYSRVRLSLRTSEHRSDRVQALIDKIEAYLSSNFQPPLRARIESLALPANNVSKYLVEGMVWSIFSSTLLVALVMCLGFRSLRAGLVGMIPNLAPVLACMGLLGWLGIPLDIATVMTFSIALGLAVDDTIHFMALYRKGLSHGNGDESKALRTTLLEIGSAMIEAAMIISSGFLILALAGLKSTVAFGVVSSLIILLAVLTDLLITPLCMLLLKPFPLPSTQTRPPSEHPASGTVASTPTRNPARIAPQAAPASLRGSEAYPPARMEYRSSP